MQLAGDISVEKYACQGSSNDELYWNLYNRAGVIMDHINKGLHARGISEVTYVMNTSDYQQTKWTRKEKCINVGKIWSYQVLTCQNVYLLYLKVK